MKKIIIILALILFPVIGTTETIITDYAFPLQEPVYIGNKILCTAWYSYKRQDMNGTKYQALNYPAREGSIVLACNSGQVISCGQMSGDRYSGWKVVILQDDGVTVEYCHLSNQWVLPPRIGPKGIALPGSKVSKGDPIGTVGRTGRTTGSHLRIVFLKSGKRMFVAAETFGKAYDDFEYRVGNTKDDLKFDLL